MPDCGCVCINYDRLKKKYSTKKIHIQPVRVILNSISSQRVSFPISISSQCVSFPVQFSASAGHVYFQFRFHMCLASASASWCSLPRSEGGSSNAFCTIPYEISSGGWAGHYDHRMGLLCLLGLETHRDQEPSGAAQGAEDAVSFTPASVFFTDLRAVFISTRNPGFAIFRNLGFVFLYSQVK